jgi:ABC-type polysaccharide/polyol phosphate transport system ATPase subunit
MKIIQLENAGINFILPSERTSNIKDFFFNFFRRQRRGKMFWALKGISFEVEKGETIGIIGENGSGKSTLLRILAGIYKPDEGNIEVEGRISTLIELGAGFHEQLTGRENIYLNGSLLGMSRKRINAIIEDIISFSELEEFIDAPIKKYSSGMLLRLGFSIAAFVEPEILLIDEVLAVGDYYFQEKCFKKIMDFKQQGKTIIFVSHDMNAIRRICDRVFLLRKGKLIKSGKVEENIRAYLKMAGPGEGIAYLKTSKLELIFNNGKLFILWKDQEVTSNIGGHNVLRYDSWWFSSYEANWRIKESSRKEIIAEGKSESLPIYLRWELKILADDRFSWEIYLISKEDFSISEHFTDLLLAIDYKKWFSSEDKGNFPPIDSHQEDWQLLYTSHDKEAKYIGVEREEDLPKVTMKLIDSRIKDVPRIYNTNFKLNSRSLQTFRAKSSFNSTLKKEQKVKLFSAELNLS